MQWNNRFQGTAKPRKTMMTATPLTSENVERYLHFWNTDSAEQQKTGEELFTPDVVQIAPVGVMTGVDALAGFAREFSSHMGAYEFRARMQPDVHHDRARLQWEIRVGDTSFAEGTDVLVSNGDGRIQSISTFLDRAPEGFDPGAHQ
jgi:hypothetical protein